ncbi:hypothetical protein LTR95_010612 [Oleoguttula sp. CCFEE 5521]
MPADQVSTRGLAAFFQEWLFFGLIVEALDGNSGTTSCHDLSRSAQTPTGESTPECNLHSIVAFPTHRQKQAIVSRVQREFVYQTDDGSYYVATHKLWAELHDSWAISLSSSIASHKQLVFRLERMNRCLAQVFYFYGALPSNSASLFLPSIKFSIGAVAEAIAQAMQPCPTDFARIVNKFTTLHTLHYLSLLNRKTPGKSHSNCKSSECVADKLDATGYRLSHLDDGCACQEVMIEPEMIVNVLKAGNAVPLLLLNQGEQNTGFTDQETQANEAQQPPVNIEVVSSENSTPYVAISHIWADGLGNKNANSLNNCKLRDLCHLVQKLPSPGSGTTRVVATGRFLSSESRDSCPLIWLDTLCCPVSSAHKKLALRRMQQVYANASSVLVLDASLRSCTSDSMGPLQILARIFTSRWLGRVWTLQEGALAKKLYFQFADKAVSLTELKVRMEAICLEDIHQRIIYQNMCHEIDRIEQFFQTRGHDRRGPNLRLLDEAMMHRRTSKLSDEPVCIGALMSLPAAAILAPEDNILEVTDARDDLLDDEQRLVQRENQLRSLRMEVVWKLLAKKFKGLPAQVIFFEEARLEAEGLRWAPRTLLDVQDTFHARGSRKLRWDDQKLATLTAQGLKVKYPGYRLKLQRHDDQPHNPWHGILRLPKDCIMFRDVATAKWFSVWTKQSARHDRDGQAPQECPQAISPGATPPERLPLQEFIHRYDQTSPDVPEFTTSPECAFLLLSEGGQEHAVDGLVMTGISRSERNWPFSLPWAAANRTIISSTHYNVLVAPSHPAADKLYVAVKKLVEELREKQCAKNLLHAVAAFSRRSECLGLRLEDDDDYKSALEVVERNMRHIMAEALAHNPELDVVLREAFSSPIPKEDAWKFIGHWFHSMCVGEPVGDRDTEGVWIVD